VTFLPVRAISAFWTRVVFCAPWPVLRLRADLRLRRAVIATTAKIGLTTGATGRRALLSQRTPPGGALQGPRLATANDEDYREV
jgi:hypothetical protein